MAYTPLSFGQLSVLDSQHESSGTGAKPSGTPIPFGQLSLLDFTSPFTNDQDHESSEAGAKPSETPVSHRTRSHKVHLIPSPPSKAYFKGMPWRHSDTSKLEFSDEDDTDKSISTKDLSLETFIPIIPIMSTPRNSLQPIPVSPNFLDHTPSLNETPPFDQN